MITVLIRDYNLDFKASACSTHCPNVVQQNGSVQPCVEENPLYVWLNVFLQYCTIMDIHCLLVQDL